MSSTFLALIVGGLISLISAIASLIVQHILNMRRMLHESKLHPSHVLYDKQIEFLDALPPLFQQINGYVTAIDVWLGEKGEEAEAEVEKLRQHTAWFEELDQLLRRYYVYLPSELLVRLEKLKTECFYLSMNPDVNRTVKCINLLFETHNALREFVGVDKLSHDLMKAIGRKPSDASEK